MEARELRIGNYLDYYGQYVIVLEIKRNENIECGYFNDSIGFERKLSENHSPKPIPLTEDWLLRFGFYWNESINHFVIHWGTNGNHFIRKAPEYNGFGLQLGEHKYKIITTVHQLQNLFYAMTENELSVKQTTEVNQ